MKNRKKTFILIEVALALLAAVVGFMMLWGQTDSNVGKVSVIVQNSDDSQWTAFKYGLKMAAMDQKLELSVVNTDSYMTTEEEKQLIENEIENGADAVIIQPAVAQDSEAMLKKFEVKVPVVLIESAASGVREDSQLPVVQPDNYAMGQALAQALLEDQGGSLNGKTLGIISQDGASEAVTNRRDGLLSALKDSGVTVAWTVLGEENEEMVLKDKPAVNFIAALDNGGVKRAGAAAAANDVHGALLYGIGRSTDAVYYLDKGTAECLIVPDEFSVGYESMSEAVKKLQHYFYEIEDKTVSYTVMRRETLFSDVNQEILFTMSQ